MGIKSCFSCICSWSKSDHFALFVWFLSTMGVHSVSFAEGNGRSPASLNPEQESLFVPLELKKERNWFQKAANVLAQKNERTVRMKETIRTWTQRREFGEIWNLESTGLYEDPSQEQRDWFMQRELFKYFTRQAGRPLKQTGREVGRDLKSWWGEVSSSGDLDSVYRDVVWLEATEEAREQSQGASGKAPELDLWSNFKLKVRVRAFRGIVNMELENPYVEAHSVIGVNGRADFFFAKSFRESRIRAALNVQLQNQFMVATVDKRIGRSWNARLLYSQNPQLGEQFASEAAVQFSYFRTF